MLQLNQIQEDLVRHLCGLPQVTPGVVKFSVRKYAEKNEMTRWQVRWHLSDLQSEGLITPTNLGRYTTYDIAKLLENRRQLRAQTDYSIWNRVVAKHDLPTKPAFIEFCESIRRKQNAAEVALLHRTQPVDGEWASDSILVTYDAPTATVYRWLGQLVDAGLIARSRARSHAITGKRLPARYFASALVKAYGKAYDSERSGSSDLNLEFNPSFFGEVQPQPQEIL